MVFSSSLLDFASMVLRVSPFEMACVGEWVSGCVAGGDMLFFSCEDVESGVSQEHDGDERQHLGFFCCL
jgi:hypothetical protein